MKIEASTRLKVTAAPISSDVQRKFMAELFKHADLKALGFYLKPSSINSDAPFTNEKFDQLIVALNKAGFSKNWTPRWAQKGSVGLATKDGKWPIVVGVIKVGDLRHVVITLNTHDTLKKSERKLDMAGFKALVKEVTTKLGVKVESESAGHSSSTGYHVELSTPNSVTVDSAKNLLKKYGVPKVFKSFSFKNGVVMDFQVDYAVLRLGFTDANELRYVSCHV